MSTIFECRGSRRDQWRVCRRGESCKNERRISADRVLEFLETIKTKLENGDDLTVEELATLNEVSEYIAGVVREFARMIQEHIVPAFERFAEHIQDLWDSLPEELRVRLAQPKRLHIELAAQPTAYNPYTNPGLPLGYISRSSDPMIDRNLS